MNTILQGTNLELSEELRNYTNEKLQDAYRAFGDMNLEAVQINVELEKTTARHPQDRESEQRYRAEANVSVPGRFIRVEASSADLKQAIVQMKEKLAREIRTWRNKVSDDARKGARKFKREISAAPESTAGGEQASMPNDD